AGAHDHAQSERSAGANHDRQSAGIPQARANGLSTNGKRRDWVTRGLDPQVHLLRKNDGLPGRKRVYARLQRAMPGNDVATWQHCCLFASRRSDTLAENSKTTDRIWSTTGGCAWRTNSRSK